MLAYQWSLFPAAIQEEVAGCFVRGCLWEAEIESFLHMARVVS
jgi:hypothetical protein